MASNMTCAFHLGLQLDAFCLRADSGSCYAVGERNFLNNRKPNGVRDLLGTAAQAPKSDHLVREVAFTHPVFIGGCIPYWPESPPGIPSVVLAKSLRARVKSSRTAMPKAIQVLTEQV